MSYPRLLTVIGTVVLLFAANLVFAEVPKSMNYQGRLTDSGGEALDTTVSMEFVIYDDSTGDNSKWSETHSAVTVTGGLFNVILGTINEVDDSVFNDTSRYLGITVGTDPEITPRSRLVTVPYSFRVSTVDGATGGIISGDVSIQSDLYVSGKATIGSGNTNSTSYSIVAGQNNTATGSRATVLGGSSNNATGNYSIITGGDNNESEGGFSVVAGGFVNSAGGQYACIGGGYSNTSSGNAITISGGTDNNASGPYSAIAGGYQNQADGDGASIGGGFRNKASGDYSTVSGGGGINASDTNVASGDYSAIGGGRGNVASGTYSTVAGGYRNIASNQYGFAAGNENEATNSAAVALGSNNLASGFRSFAIGTSANATHSNSFVWSDGSGTTSSERDDQFRVQAHGGVRFDITESSYFDFRYVLGMPSRVLTTSTGAFLSSGGVWTDDSKRSKMVNSSEIDRSDLLGKLETLPINRWSHEADDRIERIGPMADDFHAAFGVGSDDGLAANDVAGVSLAAVQALLKKIEKLEARIAELESK